MTAPWLAIVGIGEDGHLPPAALAAVRGARLVVGGRRHLALADHAICGERLAWPSPLTDAFPVILARRGELVAVLASGDPYCFGIGAMLGTVAPLAETTCHPAPSAFALARARLGWSSSDTVELSACGRPLAAIIPHLQPGAQLLVLSADAQTPVAMAALLHQRGLGRSRLTVLEAMGGPNERIRTSTADSFDLPGIQKLNTIAVTVAGSVPHHLATGLPDELFRA